MHGGHEFFGEKLEKKQKRKEVSREREKKEGENASERGDISIRIS